MKFLVSLLTVAVCLAGAAKAQDVVSFDAGKTIKNAPFSAEVTSESTQMLAGENKLTRRVTTRLYRDSDGRFRREQALVSSAIEGAQTIVYIFDPLAGVKFALNPATKIARRIKLEKSDNLKIETPKSAFGEPKIESLGSKIIEGVEAEGTRSIVQIPAGAIGNEKAFEIVYEHWFSKDLQIIVRSKHNDPRFGEQIYSVTNIVRREPDKSLFAPPADYKILDGASPLHQNKPKKNLK